MPFDTRCCATVRAPCPATRGPAVAGCCSSLVVALGFGLRLNAALNPGDAKHSSIVAYQGNDSLSYSRIAAALYGRALRHAGHAAIPTDWSPGAPLFYAAVYKLTGGVHPNAARGAVALLGALMVLFVYLIGRRLAGPAAG